MNSLSRHLSAYVYITAYTPEEKDKQDFLLECNRRYSAASQEKLLRTLAAKMKAEVVESSKKSYEPMGASSVLILADTASSSSPPPAANSPRSVLHLDTSHAAIHSYPETRSSLCYSVFRLDINVCSCGELFPASLIESLLAFFPARLFFFEYKLRGFTFNSAAELVVKDSSLHTLQDFSKSLDSSAFSFDCLVDSKKNVSLLKMKRHASLRENKLEDAWLKAVEFMYRSFF